MGFKLEGKKKKKSASVSGKILGIMCKSEPVKNVAAGFTMEDSRGMWSRRPRLLLVKNSRLRLLYIFILRGDPMVIIIRFA